MKKLLFSIMMLLASTAAMGAVVEVATAEELKTKAAEDHVDIRLTADIDISHLGKLAERFDHTIYGDGHAIIGATVPMFDMVIGAKFRNVTFKDCAIRSQELANVGIIASEAMESCVFENVHIQNSLVNCRTIPEDFGHVPLNVGGLVGVSTFSLFIGCTIDDQSGVYSERKLIDILTPIYVGGLAGYSTSDTYQDCLNRGLVSGYSYVGGLAGWAEKTRTSTCVNAGTILGQTDFFEDRYFVKFKAKEYETSTVVYGGQSYTVQTLTRDELAGTEWTASLGGLFGNMQNGSTMSQCANLSGHALGQPIGGLVGSSSASTIDRCYNYGSNKLDAWNLRHDRGGIVGEAHGTVVSNCFNAGSFGFRIDHICYGGIVGGTDPGSKVFNCISTTATPIVSNDYDSGFDGNNAGNNYHLKIEGEYWEKPWEIGVTEDYFKSGAVVYLMQQAEKHGIWTGEPSPWRQNVGEDDYPVLNPDHKVVAFNDLQLPVISTADELKAFAAKVENGDVCALARLSCDIDMHGEEFRIGSKEHPYCGIFDGAGHTIDNINYTVYGFPAAPQALGIFGVLGHRAEIHNLQSGAQNSFTNYGWEGTGGIVGQIKSAGSTTEYVVIENCGSYATLFASAQAGGILGNVNSSNDKLKVLVSKCFNMGNITASQGRSALLCGYTQNNATVTNCWSGGKLLSDAASVAPFAIVDEQHCHFVGYDKALDISGCYTFDADKNVDLWQHSHCQSGVIDYPTQMLTSGTFVYLLNGETNDPEKGLTWQQNLGGYPEPGNKGLYHTRSVTSEYGTVCLPYALRSNDNIQYYAFTSVESDDSTVNLYFEAVDEVAASKPALFCVKAAGTYSFDDAGQGYSFATYNTDVADWRMLGTFDKLTFEDEAAKSVYYVSDDAIKNAKKTTIAPFRAYLSGPSIDTLTGNDASGVKAIQLVLEDEDGVTTALELVGEDLIPEQKNGKSYTIMGTEVGEGYRGIVIRNGKKLLRK